MTPFARPTARSIGVTGMMFATARPNRAASGIALTARKCTKSVT
jgi:hypothetical protein